MDPDISFRHSKGLRDITLRLIYVAILRYYQQK